MWKVHAGVTKVFTWEKCTVVKVVSESDCRKKVGRNETVAVAWGHARSSVIKSECLRSGENICKHTSSSINLIFVSINVIATEF